MRTGPFNASGVAAVYSEATQTVPEMNPALSTFAERQSAARAILRHNFHTSNDAATSGAKGGLDARYRELHGNGNAQGVELEKVTRYLKESFQDLLDAVSLTEDFPCTI